MRRFDRRRLGAGGLLVVLIAALLVGLPPVSGHTGLTPSASPAGVIQPASMPNGNISIYVPQPTATVVPGAYLGGQYQVTVVSNESTLPPVLTVWIPQVTAVFYLFNTSIKSVGLPVTLNFTGGGPYTSGVINASSLVKVGEQPFNETRALLTSQLLSFMTNVPDDAVLLKVSWRWTIAYPDGTSAFGAWSANTTFGSAEYAQLVSYGPTTIPTNGWFQVCMASTNVTREYSLHLETIAPVVDDFIHEEMNVTGGASQPVCWSAQVASWVTPQPILAHVWAYDQKTFLLYLVKITVISPAGPWGFLGPWNSWTGVATLGALGAAAGLALWGGARFYSARRRAKSKNQDEPKTPDGAL
jgi:hypothetical protein